MIAPEILHLVAHCGARFDVGPDFHRPWSDSVTATLSLPDGETFRFSASDPGDAIAALEGHLANRSELTTAQQS